MSKKGRTDERRVELLADPARQAVESFRGYAYQVKQTVRAWLCCADNEEIYCEFAEDVDIVRRDADGQISDVELGQIKSQAGTITLNSGQTVQAINNFARHRSKDPSLKVSVRLWTISERGKESGRTWVHAENGLELWEKLQKREIASTEALRELREFLEGNNRLSGEVRAFVTSLSEDTFLNELIDRICWDTGQQSYFAIEREIARLLSERDVATRDADEARRVMDALYRYVTDLISGDPRRVLTKSGLDQFLADHREKVVPRKEFRELAANVSGLAARVAGAERVAMETALALERISGQEAGTVAFNEIDIRVTSEAPPLPRLCSKRSKAVGELRIACESNHVIWVHGWNGSGKSTLINLLIRDSGADVMWCRLRGITDFQLITILHSVIRVLRESNTPSCLLVLDDVELADQATEAMELLQIIAELLREKDGRLVITSQGSPPSRLTSMLYGRISSWSAPGMDEGEISGLLAECGLEDEESRKGWTTVIYARTRGHPQLVSAYLVHARAVNWSFSAPEFFESPDTAERVRAEGRQILVRMGEFVCELARRLSVVTGTFSRQFAIDLGSAREPLVDPGGAFDCLVGPWIQPVAKDRFVLSPLLEGYAAACFGIDGVRKYYGIAAEAWLLQRSITPEQAFQIIMTALLVPHEFLLLRLCTSLLSIPVATFSLAAKQIALIVHLDFGQMESKFSAISQFFFRHLQMKVAEENGDWERYAVLDEKLSQVVEPLREGPLSVFRLAHYVFTNCTLQSPLPLEVRLRRAIEARTIQEVGLGDADEFEGALDEYPAASLIAIAAATARTRKELESAISDLAGLNRVIAKEVAESFDQNPELGLLLTERVWSDETKRAEPDWTACFEVFQRLMVFARDAGSKSLGAASARGSMIVLDEFLNDSEAALDVAAGSRESWANSTLIDLAEIGVRLRRDEGDEALRLLERVENGTDARVYALERAMSLTRVLRFLASTSDQAAGLEKMARVVAWGERIGRTLDDSLMGNLVRVGFQCERGLLLHCMGQSAEAAQTIERTVSELEEFPDQSFSVFRAIRFRVGQCCGLLARARWKGPDDKIPPRSMMGWIADFTDPASNVLEFPAASYPELWSILAVYAARVQNCEVARRCAKRGRGEDGGEHYYVAINQGIEALYICDLLEDDVVAAFRSGFEWTRLMAIGLAAGLDGDDRIRQKIDFEQMFAGHRLRVVEVWEKTIAIFLLEPLFMTLCSASGSRRADFDEWRRALESQFGGKSSGPIDSVALMETGLLAADGEEFRAIEAARKITDDVSPQNGERRRLMMLACCGSKAFSPGELLGYQVAMLCAAAKMPQSVWAVCFFRMLAKRWLFVIENQKFQLSRPDRSVPKLLEAAEKSLRCLDVRSSADLLIAAADAAAVSLPREMGQELRRLSES